ncbi:type II secretion system F family protein [Pseudoalteromonas distincta]|uniref:type II secretion system F family protein n=1 Tax=Pseudoalteromonas distincta TaxID=77608 RepID=UPI0032E0915E
MLFEYKAYDSLGAKNEGQIEAQSKQEALLAVEKLGLFALEIKEVSERSNSLFQSNKISLSDLEFLTAELSLLLESGVRIDKGIDIIRRTKAKPALAKLLSDLNQKIKKGSNLSAACREHPDVFDELYCNLIELGEASGKLSDVFADLAKDLKFKRDLRSKIIGSLTYPSVIFFVCILSIFFIFNVIIPKMASMFEGADDLPWYTKFMLDTSAWMVNYQGWLIVGGIAFIGAIHFAAKTTKFQNWWQSVCLKLPVISKAIITIERIRFNSGLAMMIKAGVPIDKALGLSAGNIKNLTLKREMEIAKQKVKRGSLLAPTLKQTSIYPAFYVSLLEVGEESGNLERVFDEIANRSRADFESWTQKMTTLLEPLMILFMGGFVGGVVVIMLLSMVSMNDIGI